MSHTKKSYLQNWFLPLIFLALLALPAIEGTFDIWEFERKSENRTFKDKLIIHIAKLDRFPKDCEAYVNDNFPFRPPLLDAYHRLKVKFFRNSPHPKKVLIGENDWYFVTAMEKHLAEGRYNFTEQQLDAAAKEWHRRKNYLDSLGIKFHWVIAPYKYDVYNDQLPYNFYYQGYRRATQLKNRLDAEFPNLIIDPVPALVGAKDSSEVYYRLDNHWNYRGGNIAANLILDELRTDFPNANIPPPPNYHWEKSEYHGGYLHDALGVEELSEIREKPCCISLNGVETIKYYFTPPDGFAYANDYEHTFVNDTLENGLKLLVIRDSFGGQVMPFLRESFYESTDIFDMWKYALNKEIIETVKPDVLIYIGLETHIETIFKGQLE